MGVRYDNSLDVEFDYSKLNGRIIEKYGTRTKFAEALGVSDGALSKKLSNKIRFTQAEIILWSELLEIELNDILAYFFCLKGKGELNHA